MSMKTRRYPCTPPTDQGLQGCYGPGDEADLGLARHVLLEGALVVGSWARWSWSFGNVHSVGPEVLIPCTCPAGTIVTPGDFICILRNEEHLLMYLLAFVYLLW